MGKIISIVYQPDATDVSDNQFNLIPIDKATIIKAHGIEGDRKAGRHPRRNINIMVRETLDKLAEAGFSTAPGEMGEQIQVSGLDIESMEDNTLIQLGESVVVRLNKPRRGCIWLEHIQGQSIEQTTDMLGRMVTVIEGGIIHVGDEVRLAEKTHNQSE